MSPSINLIWGCDPSIQYETSWLLSLFSHFDPIHYDFFNQPSLPPSFNYNFPTVVFESGIHTLQKNISKEAVDSIISSRRNRIQYLSDQCRKLIIVHFSDEEGNDGELFYKTLPSGLPIYRNFYHSRLVERYTNLFTFPIGPRDVFLDIPDKNISKSSRRSYPWTFMGTLWPSGSRKLAVSNFLAYLPSGYYFGGNSFGQGVPLNEYKSIMLNSTFSLAPEGDRHLDTFRLWESLSCGCIPLLQDFNDTARFLLPNSCPIPVFDSWHNAVCFAKDIISKPNELDSLQVSIFNWWNCYKFSISSELKALIQ